MARQLDIDATRGELLRVYPQDIIVDAAENGRAFPYNKEDLYDLLEDLDAGRGIKVPLECRPVLFDGKKTLKLVYGFRRHAAALVFNQEHPDRPIRVPTIVREINAEQALLDNIDENLKRRSLTAPDFAKIVENLEAQGKSLKEVSGILRCSESQIGQYKLVGMLPSRIQKLGARRGASTDTLLTLAALPEEQQEAALEEALSRAGVTEEEVVRGEKKLRARVARSVAKDSGANVGSMRMSELKKYLEGLVETEGPGSTPGAVGLAKQLLRFIEGKFGEKTMDKAFDQFCKTKL